MGACTSHCDAASGLLKLSSGGAERATTLTTLCARGGTGRHRAPGVGSCNLRRSMFLRPSFLGLGFSLALFYDMATAQATRVARILLRMMVFSSASSLTATATALTS